MNALSQLARWIPEKIRVEPWTTTDLRNEVIRERGCSRSQFDNALKDLGDLPERRARPRFEQDTWVTFQEVYPDIWNKYVSKEQ